MRYLIHDTKDGKKTVRWATDKEAEAIKNGRDPRMSFWELDPGAEWVDVVLSYKEYMQLKRNVEAWKRRLKGMQEAVRRWRVKAGVDEPPGEEVIMAERKQVRTGKDKWEWRYYEHRTIPVEKSPHLAREAWKWLMENHDKDDIERMYYHEKHGWVAVFHVEW